MKTKTLSLLGVILLTSVAFLSSCKDDDDSTPGGGTVITPNEEEVITTVNIILTDTAGVRDTVVFSDPDGDGGDPPVIGSITLERGINYTVALEFKDASDPNDVEDITAEIQEEDDEHLICFEVFNTSGVTIQRTDSDGMFEVGLASNWMVSSSAASVGGTIRLTLKHQPGVKDGTCAPGDTDVEIDFPLSIN